MVIRFKKLVVDAIIPTYAKLGDAGLDLTAISKEDKGETPEGFIEYGTGIAIEIPEGFVGYIFPRSSITNKPMILKNSVGVIDSGYRGEIKLRFLADLDNVDKNYKIGERIGQLIIMPIPIIKLEEVEELTNSERGVGGHGSTGI